MKKVFCYTIGVTRGNPGPAGLAVVVTDEKSKVLDEVVDLIGNTSQDLASYQAVMVGLETLLRQFGAETKNIDVEILLDNESVRAQLGHELMVESPGLVPMFMAIHNLKVANFSSIRFVMAEAEKAKGLKQKVETALDGK